MLQPLTLSPTASAGLAGQETRIGPYRIIRPLGQGGMGVVYLAEQTEPVRREVAIKLLTTGVDSDVIVARFETERQALAVMEHPNITKVFDAGVSEAGVPYFVMERVSGVPLTEYADAHHLGNAERIRLFTQICRAVQHAHQKGIIHRDLKPSNVLVTEEDGAPVCKVIDFGIAKATAGADTARLTQTGIAIGTPAYMSPEQITGSGLDIDTRTDIYSMGVMLYELMAGVLPFDPGTYRGLALLAQHTAVEAPPASARVAALPAEQRATLAAARGTDASGLARALQGDLDWITLKTLEKERDRRYDSAIALAEDLERHLANEPVQASPPSRSYRARKFVRRHRTGVAFVAIVAALLIGFSGAVTVQARRLARARTVAEQRQGQAEDLIGFMVGDLQSRLVTLGRLDLLDAVAVKSQAYFAAVPEAELTSGELFRRSQALRQLGEVRVNQGKLDSAMRSFRQSLALAAQLAPRDTLNGDWQLGLGASHFWVGSVHYQRNDLDSALAHFVPYLRLTEALVRRSPENRTYRLELGLANSNIGSTREAKGDLSGALEAFRAKVAIIEDLVRRDSSNLAWLANLANGYNTVAVIQRKLGDLHGAEVSHRHELALKQALVRRDTANKQYPQAVAFADAFLGELLVNEGNVIGADEPLHASRDILAMLAARDTANPDRRRLLANADRLLGFWAFESADAPQANRALESGRALIAPLAARKPVNRGWQYMLARVQTLQGSVQLEMGRAADAETSERSALAVVEAALKAKPSDQNARVATTEAALVLGEVLARSGRLVEARASWQQAFTTIDSAASASRLTDHLALLATALIRLDRIDDARPVAAEVLRRGYRRPHWLALVRQRLALPSS